jgi:hypothetical protein
MTILGVKIGGVMDILYLLAGAKDSPLITESFLKWVCGFMGAAIVALFAYVREIIKEQKADLKKQIEDAPDRNKNIEEPIRARYVELIEDKETKIVGMEKELTGLRVERLQFLQSQIEDAKLQEKGFAELSEDYNALVTDHIEPLLAQSIQDKEKLVEVIRRCTEVLEYYRRRRERSN